MPMMCGGLFVCRSPQQCVQEAWRAGEVSQTSPQKRPSASCQTLAEAFCPALSTEHPVCPPNRGAGEVTLPGSSWTSRRALPGGTMLPVCPLPIIAIGAGNAFAAFRWCLYELFFADRQAPLQHIDEHVHELSIDSPGQGLLWDVACGEGIVAMRAPLSTKRWVFGQFDSAIAWKSVINPGESRSCQMHSNRGEGHLVVKADAWRKHSFLRTGHVCES